MPTFSFTLDNTQTSRLSNSLDLVGYKFDSSSGVSDANQRIAYAKKITKDFWSSLVFNAERKSAIALEPNDSAALQLKRFVDLSNITTN